MPITYEPIATTTVGSATAEVTFSGISGSYTDLVAVITGTRSTTGNSVLVRINSDTGSNYSTTIIDGNGTSAISERGSNMSSGIGVAAWKGNGSDQMVVIVNIMNYANTTTYKTVLSRYGQAGTGTEALVGLWRSTAAITSLTFRSDNVSNLFSVGSVLTLYGIKAA